MSSSNIELTPEKGEEIAHILALSDRAIAANPPLINPKVLADNGKD